MILILHVITALGSLLVAGITNIKPSALGLKITYILTGLMLGTGGYLLIHNTSHLLESCLFGLLVLGVVLIEVIVAKRKLIIDLD